MKRNLRIILSIFVFVGLLQTWAQEITKSEISTNKTMKLGIVQFDALMRRMPATKKVYGELEKMANSYQAELTKMTKEGQDKFENLQAKSAGLDPAIRKVLEQELNEIQQRIQILQMTAEQELQKKQNDLMPIAETLTASIKQYGSANQFSAIFFDTALVYPGELQDVTESIAKQLNLPKDSLPTSPAGATTPGPAKPATKK